MGSEDFMSDDMDGLEGGTTSAGPRWRTVPRRRPEAALGGSAMMARRAVLLIGALVAAGWAADGARATERRSLGHAAAAGLYGPLDGGERVRPGEVVGVGRAGATVAFRIDDGSATTTVTPSDGAGVALRGVGVETVDGSVARIALKTRFVTVLAVGDGGTDNCVEAVALMDEGRPGATVRDLGSACERWEPRARVTAHGRTARLEKRP